MKSFGESRLLLLLVSTGLALAAIAVVCVFGIAGDPGGEAQPLIDNVFDDETNSAEFIGPDPVADDTREASTQDERVTARVSEGDAEQAPGAHLFQGTVLNAAYEPVRSFSITVYGWKEDPDNARWAPLGVTALVRDDNGRFELERDLGEVRLCRFKIKAGGHHVMRTEEYETEPGMATRGLQFVLEPLPTFGGYVVAADTGKQVVKAAVFSATDCGGQVGFDEGIPEGAARTDALGQFVLRVDSDGPHTLVARHPDFCESVLMAGEPAHGKEIVLYPGYRISGRAFGRDGEPAVSATVLIRGDRGGGLPVLRHRLKTDDQGDFRSDPLLPGAYSVGLEEAEGLSAGTTFDAGERVRIHDRDVEDVQVGCVPGRGILSGHLFSGDRAVVGARIKFNFYPNHMSMTSIALWHRTSEEPVAVTGDEGEFNMLSLPEGRYYLSFSLAGGRKIGSDEVDIAAGAQKNWSFNVGEARIRGRLVDSVSGKPVAGRESFCLFKRGLNLPKNHSFTKDRIAVGPTGRFEIPYLMRGDYTLVAGAKGYGFEVVRIFTEGSGVKSLDIPLHRTGVVLAEVTATVPFTASDLTFRFPMERCWIPLEGTAFKRDRRGRFHINRAGPGATEITCVLRGQELPERLWIGAGQSVPVHYYFDPPIEDPPIRVEGRVLSGGAPVVHCRVVLKRDWSGPLMMGQGRRHSDAVSAPTDSEGNYELEIARAGQYRVLLTSSCGDSLPVLGGRNLLILDSPYRLDLCTGNSVLSGTVVNATSDGPIAGAIVQWKGEIRTEGHYYERGRSRFLYPQQLTDEQGRFYFAHVAHGDIRLSVFAPGFLEFWNQRKIAPLAPGETMDVTVRLGEGCGSLKMILSGKLPSIDILRREGNFWIGDSYFRMDHLTILDSPEPGTLALLGHAFPVGKNTVWFRYRSRGVKHGGEAEVEIKAGETTEVRIEVE